MAAERREEEGNSVSLSTSRRHLWQANHKRPAVIFFYFLTVSASFFYCMLRGDCGQGAGAGADGQKVGV